MEVWICFTLLVLTKAWLVWMVSATGSGVAGKGISVRIS